MSTFLTRDDYLPQIRDTKLKQLLEGNNALLDAAEGTAIQVVRDNLYGRYDVDAVFSATGSDRQPAVVRWCTCLALYYLWERAPDRLLPTRIKDNYEMTMAVLHEISDGKSSVELPRLIDPEGAPVTKFRWGGDAPRSW